jgi:small subunit ribosomal protein S8
MNKIIKLLNKIKNASLVNKVSIEMGRNLFIDSLIVLLYNEGLIQSFFFKKVLGKSLVIIFLRYFTEQSPFFNMKILISSSYFNYIGISDIFKISNKKNIFIFSTSKGVCTDIICKKKNVGGILLCKI